MKIILWCRSASFTYGGVRVSLMGYLDPDEDFLFNIYDTNMYSSWTKNRGGVYDPLTGIFIAPVDGEYQFNLKASVHESPRFHRMYLFIMRANMKIAYMFSDKTAGSGSRDPSLPSFTSQREKVFTYKYLIPMELHI
ncbi:hypothetical protein CHS0354_037910 [Potamilus streckersoni]|uniref:C1q domain-containing protein n=1 Tax=Potamilus streckersoni TaxID=2493646 RepID=A0AAE0T9Q5_9BIVA|nr:hypothetical protein CHS0354_037910 [Potamilus streckersoni]